MSTHLVDDLQLHCGVTLSPWLVHHQHGDLAVVDLGQVGACADGLIAAAAGADVIARSAANNNQLPRRSEDCAALSLQNTYMQGGGAAHAQGGAEGTQVETLLLRNRTRAAGATPFACTAVSCHNNSGS